MSKRENKLTARVINAFTMVHEGEREGGSGSGFGDRRNMKSEEGVERNKGIEIWWQVGAGFSWKTKKFPLFRSD